MKNWKTSAESILTTGPVVPVIVVKKLNTRCRWQKRWLLVGCVLEVTLRTEVQLTLSVLSPKKCLSDCGAGTVLNPQQLAEVTEAGCTVRN